MTSRIMTSRSVVRSQGFTLIELLVVISIIALLIALLLPALGKAKDNALMMQSLSQKRQLTLGWATFPNDHDGGLVGAFTNGKAGGGWVNAVPGATPSSIPRSERIAAIQDGLLWEYLQSIDVYKTPNDPRQFTMRSDSISNFLNGSDSLAWNPDNIKEAFPVKKIDELQKPSQTMVFLEELDPRGDDNQGSWVMGFTRRGRGTWIDWPGNLFLNGNVQSFADGHAVFYKFKSMDTATIDRFNAPIGGGTADYDYYLSIYQPHFTPSKGRSGRRGPR